MSDNMAVDYQNPAHGHSGTSETSFTVAQSGADKTRLTATGVERVGSTPDLPLELAARGKAPVQALGGPLVVGSHNKTSGGFLPRPYTADPAVNPHVLILAGGDYRGEFTSNLVHFTDTDRYRYCGRSRSYNAVLNQTEITLNEPVTATSGFVVDACAQGLVAGFGNIAAGCSVALGQLCVAVGAPSLAAGLACRAFGNQSFAFGNGALACGASSVALGEATAGSYRGCALGRATAGSIPSSIQSLVGMTVTIQGDARSRFAMVHNVLIFSVSGDRHQTLVISEPTYDGGVTSFDILDPTPFTAEGIVDIDMGLCAFATGSGQATGDYSHAEGCAAASGNSAHGEGWFSLASGMSAHAEGYYTTASAQYAHAEGYYTIASAKGSHASGYYASANKQHQRALASGRFAETGDSQYTEVVLRRATTNATPAELTLDGAAPSGTTENTSNRFLCATGKTYACLVLIAARKSDGASAFFMRQVIVKNVSGTVSLEGTVQTVGVDINPAGWTAPAITADNTNKSLVITVTGAASTNLRWSATVQAQEIKY